MNDESNPNRPDGKWAMTSQTPMGPQEGVLTLSSAGNDVTGTMHGPQGEIEIDEGKLDGATVSWVVHTQVPIPMDVVFTAKIAGDGITGEAQLGAMGTMTISGTRMES